jgi:hypothetical protein
VKSKRIREKKTRGMRYTISRKNFIKENRKSRESNFAVVR